MNPLKLVAGTVGVGVLAVAGALFVPGGDPRNFHCGDNFTRSEGEVHGKYVVTYENADHLVSAREVTEAEAARISQELNKPIGVEGYMITVMDQHTMQFLTELPEGCVAE